MRIDIFHVPTGAPMKYENGAIGATVVVAVVARTETSEKRLKMATSPFLSQVLLILLFFAQFRCFDLCVCDVADIAHRFECIGFI